MRQLSEHARSRGERNFTLPAAEVAIGAWDYLLEESAAARAAVRAKGDPEVLPELTELREFVFDVAGNLASPHDVEGLIKRGADICKRYQLPRPEMCACTSCEGSGRTADNLEGCSICEGTGLIPVGG